jgi:hypothetical protein
MTEMPREETTEMTPEVTVAVRATDLSRDGVRAIVDAYSDSSAVSSWLLSDLDDEGEELSRRLIGAWVDERCRRDPDGVIAWVL